MEKMSSRQFFLSSLLSCSLSPLLSSLTLLSSATRDLLTSQTFTNGPVGIDDLRERLCFQAPLRTARNLIAAIDSRPWWEVLLFGGGLHAVLMATAACTPQDRWEMVIKSLIKDEKVADLYISSNEDRLSLVDMAVTAYQRSRDSTQTIRATLARLLSASPEARHETVSLLPQTNAVPVVTGQA